MRIRCALTACLVSAVSAAMPALLAAQVPPHRAQEIRKAARQIQARVAPDKARTVLIFNTPPHLMEKDPHKGYCIPYGEEALRAIGQESEAFDPVARARPMAAQQPTTSSSGWGIRIRTRFPNKSGSIRPLS